MRRTRLMVHFCLILLGLLAVSCGNMASNQPTKADDDKIVVAYSNDNHGEIAPCG